MLKNITLNAEEELIRKAREKAQREHTTLNASFRQWLKQYANKDMGMNDYESLMNSLDMGMNDYESLMNSLDYVKPGRKFTRDEMNER